MTEIMASDWDALQGLARRVGLPDERVSLLRRRSDNCGTRPGNPYVLLAGRPDAGIELLLARWLSPEATDELQKVGGRPLVIGATPNEVRPRIGTWPGWKWPKFGPGHLLVLRTAGRPTADTLAQLLSLGYLDQVVVVTRLGQPLHMQERELAQALASVSATVRVLIVGLPGEEPTEGELAEVTAFAVSQMRQAGFRAGRCLGAAVWYTGGEKRSGTIADVGQFTAVDPTAVADGRNGMIRNALRSLIQDIGQKAEQLPTAAVPVPDSECDRLIRELGSYLADLGRELNRQTEKPVPLTTEVLRRYAVDALRGWGAYAGIEGHWLKYVEKIRPGTQAAFLAEAESAMSVLDFQPGSKPVEIAAPVESSPMVERLIVEAKRMGVGLALALVGYVLVLTTLGGQGAGLPPLAVTLLSYVTLLVGVILGYAAARPFFRVPLPGPRPEPPPVVRATVNGWLQIERRLTGWFSDHIRAKPASPAEECRALALRFGTLELDP